MSKRDAPPKVFYRYCDDMEHIIVYWNKVLLSDEYESFSKSNTKDALKGLAIYVGIELNEYKELIKLTVKDVLEYLAKHKVIELKEEEIIDDNWNPVSIGVINKFIFIFTMKGR